MAQMSAKLSYLSKSCCGADCTLTARLRGAATLIVGGVGISGTEGRVWPVMLAEDPIATVLAVTLSR